MKLETLVIHKEFLKKTDIDPGGSTNKTPAVATDFGALTGSSNQIKYMYEVVHSVRPFPNFVVAFLKRRTQFKASLEVLLISHAIQFDPYLFYKTNILDSPKCFL